jgi:hypothetical protein
MMRTVPFVFSLELEYALQQPKWICVRVICKRKAQTAEIGVFYKWYYEDSIEPAIHADNSVDVTRKDSKACIYDYYSRVS